MESSVQPAPKIETENQSQKQIGKLQSALAKAQGAFPVIPKDSKVEVKSKEGKLLYTYKYADLTTIIHCTRPAMSENGLSFTQGVTTGGFVTTIMHESGEQLRTGFIPCQIPNSQDMKQVAAIITYVKRISLTAALGVSADEDVDAGSIEAGQGNSTSKKPADPKQGSTPPKKDPPAGGLKNHAAGIKAKDPHPPTESQSTEGLQYLLDLVARRSLPPEYMKTLIKKLCGKEKRASACTEAEITKIIDYIESNKV